jgi:hypothetical protein
MITELIKQIKDDFSQDVLVKAGGRFDEEPPKIARTIEGLVPAILAALLKKNSSSGQTGLSNMIAVSRDILGDPTHPISKDLNRIFTDTRDPNGINLMKQTEGILENVFGDRLQPLSEAISRFSHIKPSSALQLLAIATPATLSGIGQYMDHRGIDDRELMQELTTGKQTLIEHVPAGLDLSAALGIDKLADLDIRPSIPDHNLAAAEKIAPGKSGKWLVLIIIIILILVAIWFWKNYNKKQASYQLKVTSAMLQQASCG